MSILLVIIILVVLILVHEAGHFVAAKFLGVRVEEFGVGYPPRAFTIFRSRETEYTINWLPFGGFVRLFGEDPTRAVSAGERKISFSGASRSAQALILIAGVAANMVFAWALYTGGLMSGMPTAVTPHTPGAQLMISAVVPNSPAEKAGLLPGDQLMSVIDRTGRGVPELSAQAVMEFTSERGGEPLELTYRRGESIASATIIPAHAVLEEASGRPALGISLTSVANKRLSLTGAMVEAVQQTTNAFTTVLFGLYHLAKDALTGGANLASVVGPVGLVTIVGDATGYGLGYVLGLAAFISVNLAIINLLPIPALDGGRLVFVAIESITRRVTPRVLFQVLNTVGFALILLLMLAVTYNDIVRIAG